MAKIAKLFMNGRSQAVRLPREFRFPGREVVIRRNPETGEIVLSPYLASQPNLSFDEWFAKYDAIPDNAPEEEFAKLPAPPKNLTLRQWFRILDRADYPEEFFERRTSLPRDLDLL